MTDHDAPTEPQMAEDTKAQPLFFSYAHADREKASAIIAALEKVGHTVWWDDHLEGGSAFATSIDEALQSAAVVIVLWSENSVKSHWVADEAQQGRDRGRLVPLLIDGAQPPLGFRQLHYIPMDDWNGDSSAPEIERLHRAIATCLGAPIPAASLASANHAGGGARSTGTSRRTLLLAGGGIGAVAAIGGLGFLLTRDGAPSLAENGVAVLPFRNLSGDPEQDYLSFGLSAEVRAVLARNTALRVVAQASSEAVKDRAMSAAEMAKTLAVSFLLDGNVSRAGDSVRIMAELIDGRTGFNRWSDTFERPLSELSTLQDAIASAVTAALALGDGDATGSYGVTGNAVAFNDFLKGRELYESAISTETDLSALAHFDRAIEGDPAFGAAHAARARTLTVLGNSASSVTDAKDFYAKAQSAARRAVEFGADSADAHSTLGYVLFQTQLKIADARGPYERSYELGRGEATVLARYAAYAASTRNFDMAEEAVLRARDLDPLNAAIHRAVGYVRYAAGRYEESIVAVRRALELNPKLSDSHARIAMAQYSLGRFDDALTEVQKERSGLVKFPALAIIHAQRGDDNAADSAMASLIETYGDAGLYQQAQVLARQGEADRALMVLRTAFEFGDSGLTYAYIDPAFEGLRNREDFQELIKALGYV